MRSSLDKYIGNGLYTIPEAARYARVDPNLIRRWLLGASGRKPILTPQFGNVERRISFLDLIQTLAIRQIRIMHHVPTAKIRQAIRWVKEHLNQDYPFARRHFTYLFDTELVVELKKGQYVEVTGANPGQGLIKEIVQSYLLDLTFDGSGLANKFTIYRSRDQVPVVLDPERRFGEPLLPSGYSAKCLWDAIKAEGSVNAAAEAYGVPKAEVTAAFDFVDLYRLYAGATAA